MLYALSALSGSYFPIVYAPACDSSTRSRRARYAGFSCVPDDFLLSFGLILCYVSASNILPFLEPLIAILAFLSLFDILRHSVLELHNRHNMDPLYPDIALPLSASARAAFHARPQPFMASLSGPERLIALDAFLYLDFASNGTKTPRELQIRAAIATWAWGPLLAHGSTRQAFGL
ncbi:hypothetical protein B0H13DRAFT_2358664 [Mycena leptocephala]|nr:hypothetical protein B0H13DRAFT_2358664 [Mycena leptocephala]